MSQELRLIAILDLKSDSWDHISKAVKECVVETRKEKGNISYTAYWEKGNPNRIIFIEYWAGQTVLDLHMKTEHFKNLSKIVEPYLKHPMQILGLNEITV